MLQGAHGVALLLETVYSLADQICIDWHALNGHTAALELPTAIGHVLRQEMTHSSQANAHRQCYHTLSLINRHQSELWSRGGGM